MSSECVTGAQVEHIAYRDGVVRVVHKAPLEPTESFQAAVNTAYEYLLENGRYKLFAAGLHKMIPPDFFAQHPESAARREADQVLVEAGELEADSVTFLQL